MISDEQIIEGCLSGKRKAYNRLYRKYAAVMMGICMRYCKNRDDAEDVLQEGFIKVFSNMEKYRHEGSFEGWIKRIMVNTAIDHYQSNLRHAYHKDINAIEETTILDSQIHHDPDPSPFLEMPKEKLISLIQSLPDGYRMVFNLFAIEGYTHRQIADSLGVTENTSKTQLMKARRSLREKLAEEIQKHVYNNQVS
jgi:RNA polymerase sigma-70 factor (ECF subfamily)